MPVPVIKTIAVEPNDTSESIHDKLQPYEGVVSYFLFDTSKEGQAGGTGISFDWDILVNVYTETPWFVAGGIGPGNVGDVVKKLRPFGVDANSKLESEPGMKQLEKYEFFFDEIRAIWKHQDPE